MPDAITSMRVRMKFLLWETEWFPEELAAFRNI
jgi:hypothetical protein